MLVPLTIYAHRYIFHRKIVTMHNSLFNRDFGISIYDRTLYIYWNLYYTILYYMYLIVRPPLYNIPGSATAEKGTELNIFTEFNCAIHW